MALNGCYRGIDRVSPERLAYNDTVRTLALGSCNQFCNESLDFVNIEQQEAGLLPFGVNFKNPNLAQVAEALGAKGIRLEDPGDVRDALSEALSYRDGPVVVDAVVDPFALSLPSHVPFHTARGYTLSLAKQVLYGRMDSVIKTIERNARLV